MATGDAAFAHDLVAKIEVQSAFLVDEQFQEIRHVVAEHGAGVLRHPGGQVGIPDDGDAVVAYGFPVLRKVAVAAGAGGQIDHHAAWTHFFHRLCRQQQGRLAAAYLCRGNHQIGFGCAGLYFGALALEEFLALLNGIATRAAIVHRAFDFHELGAEAFHLFLGSSARIERLHSGAQTARRGDGLQARHPGAQHQHLGRFDTAGCRHHHGDVAAQLRGADQHGLVAGDGSHRRKHVHCLRQRGARDHVEAERDKPLLVEVGSNFGIDKGLKLGDQHSAEFNLFAFFFFGRKHAHQKIGGVQHFLARYHPGVLGIFCIGEKRRIAGAAFHHDIQAGNSEFGEVGGGEGNAGVVGFLK